jgi:prefoldin beta subunit
LILLLTKLFKILKSNSILQDTSEAKQNVDKRIGYINGELKRQEDLLAELDKKQEEEREKLQTLQNQMQKLAQA